MGSNYSLKQIQYNILMYLSTVVALQCCSNSLTFAKGALRLSARFDKTSMQTH